MSLVFPVELFDRHLIYPPSLFVKGFIFYVEKSSRKSFIYVKRVAATVCEIDASFDRNGHDVGVNVLKVQGKHGF
ncbi:hypothetical protein DSLASN_20680 [Desulfoluna limicola]|uniref:Transposase n=1 Tax=Desulfoluna limicola TaxID=2810562 RepID=A0ABN6F495_9BACT|nr:hypothetical protein DSLASN_20680 [Desulfoluna limicola]